MSALSKYEDGLRSYPPRGSGLHQFIMGLACLGAIAELPPETVIQDMNASLAGIKPNEASDAVKKAFATDRAFSEYEPIKAKPTKKPKTIDDFINHTPRDPLELWEISPIPLEDPDNDALLLLETLYSDQEYLFIGDVFDSRVYRVGALKKANLASQPHIIPNPMTGKEGITDMGKASFRCENAVADARFAVCEMDDVPIEKQTAFWMECIRIGIPVSAVIHSGRKSLHGWVRVDCGTDVEKWDELVRGWWFKEFGKKYGLDTACQNRARLSRLPSHKREGGKQQHLIYLNGDV